ncbi:class III lanthionine synthetase LanKC [Nocardiopsis ganjiahuensis]|uniref:class III lanthionine synthetase LanKC n=1 Tax=Nocardiopsis ganjiahuensis TaxID=239984 RepID=UPI000349D221|nr:class III lanthionine synthetase LanKC [Nocardiopsis ganjiahuensis]
MLDLVEMYTLADPVFFEDPSRITSDSPLSVGAPVDFTVTGSALPEGWSRTRSGHWHVVSPDAASLPEQGWKIHVSATVETADATCRAVWDHCTEHGLTFKHLLNRNLLVAANTKYAPRASSGKLLTIYTRDEDELERTLRGLSARIGGGPGPRVLSDLRWEEGPLYVRYGAFREMWCPGEHGAPVPALRHPDGTLVPDRRLPAFSPPSWVTLPSFLKPHADAASGGERQPYVIDRALHFSNAGGIYLARREEDGTQVVLKEARPHAGLDGDLRDAVERQVREEANLRRLVGVPGVPQLLGSFTLGGHRFLVQEYREGRTLGSWCTLHHPGIADAHAGEEAIAAFTSRALRVLERLEEILAAVHARGLVFADLHSNNVLVGPDDTVSLVDYELSFDASDTDHRPPLGAAGFATRARSGTDLDLYALAATRLAVFIPFSRIIALDPDKAAELVELLQDSFPVPRAFADGIARELVADPAARTGAPRPSRVGREPIAAGILASAEPTRTDRLFPGDLQQFLTGGYGMAHGAAGVLWALDRAGLERSPELEAWLVAASRRLRSPHPGFYDGVAGLAYVLDHLGHREEAAALVERDTGADHEGISLFSGLAGTCANLAHFAGRGYGTDHMERALALADRLSGAVDAARRQSSEEHRRAGRTGLMRGWSGVALCFLHLYRSTGDTSCLDTAVRALHLDLDQSTVMPDGTRLLPDRGVRALPNIEAGGLGCALVAKDLLEYREDGRCAEDLPALERSCHTSMFAQADLFHGKAGQLAALARLGGAEQDLRSRTLELEWYALPFRGHTAFPSGRMPRLSMDLATGGAGVLLALSTAAGGGGPFLPFFAEPPGTGGRGEGNGAARG